MSDDNPDKKYQLQDLQYYFDGKVRDRLDRGSLGRRNAEVLDLRDRLLRLDEKDYRAALRAIESIVSKPSSNEDQRNKEQKQGDLARLLEKYDAE